MAIGRNAFRKLTFRVVNCRSGRDCERNPEINATSNTGLQELAKRMGAGAWRTECETCRRVDALSAADELDDAIKRTRTLQILDIDKAAFDLPKLAQHWRR